MLDYSSGCYEALLFNCIKLQGLFIVLSATTTLYENRAEFVQSDPSIISVRTLAEMLLGNKNKENEVQMFLFSWITKHLKW